MRRSIIVLSRKKTREIKMGSWKRTIDSSLSLLLRNIIAPIDGSCYKIIEKYPTIFFFMYQMLIMQCTMNAEKHANWDNIFPNNMFHTYIIILYHEIVWLCFPKWIFCNIYYVSLHSQLPYVRLCQLNDNLFTQLE